MSGPKGCGFLTVLVRNRAGKSQILAFIRVRILGSTPSIGCSTWLALVEYPLKEIHSFAGLSAIAGRC